MRKSYGWAVVLIALFVGATLGPPLAGVAKADLPAPHAVLFNDAVSSGTDLVADMRPDEGKSSAYRITIALASTDSVLNWVVKSGATTVATDLNNGTALTAGRTYTFTVGAARASTAGEALTFNLRVETGTTITVLVVDRVDDGAL